MEYEFGDLQDIARWIRKKAQSRYPAITIRNAKKNLEIRIFMGLPDFRNGGSCGIRTYDQLVKSQLLYQLS
jgi:hypothetical protein